MTCFEIDTETRAKTAIATFTLEPTGEVSIAWADPVYALCYQFDALHGADGEGVVRPADGQAFLDALPEQGWTWLTFDA